jgi:transposase
VHARSVAAAAIDGVTGELVRSRLTPSVEDIGSWLRELPGPVAVAYEADPTGFGFYRHLTEAGVQCVVVAPSKLHRPAGDRVKTDARDAVLLARLLRLDEVRPVAVPTVAQEAARDLVRAREDCRGDLMRARHRLSKLLLRHGIVYCGGAAWTGAHDIWLRGEPVARLTSTATRQAFESDYEAVAVVKGRRDRLDAAITQLAAASEFTAVVQRLGCLRGISTLTGFALAVEIGDWHRFTGASIGSFVGLTPAEHSSGSSRTLGPITKTATVTSGGCWSRRPGITGPAIGSPLSTSVSLQPSSRPLPGRRHWPLEGPAAVGKGRGMEVVHARCAGLDVSKRNAKVCVRIPGRRAGSYVKPVTTFGSVTADILRLRDQLIEAEVTLVVMEATGDHWKPFFFILEDGPFEVVLANPRHVKNLPGRKSDVSDAQWLAELGARGPVRGSFVPPQPIRELRDLTRLRTTLTRDRAR